MTTVEETFQITPQAAEAYEARFVPAIFAEWAPRLIAHAGVAPGDQVLDVACGTGIAARTAAEVVGDAAVTGVDLNPAMLDVARRVRPQIAWRQGDVAALPFGDASFDAALCQMALMFFHDPGAALAEMARVSRDRVGVVVPAALEDQSAYRSFTHVVASHAGAEGASLVGAYWSCGDLQELRALVSAVGLRDVEIATITGTARFASSDELVATEVEGSPLIERIDDATYAAIREDCREALAPWLTATGLEAPLVCHILGARVR